MAGQLKIQLFASPSITFDGKLVTRFHSSKVAALLYFLAATDRAHTRDRLASLFWGDLAEAQSKKNLRNTLYYIPDVLKNSFEITRDAAKILLGEGDEVDSLLFLRGLAAAEKLSKGSPEWVETLEAAAERYQGEFLQGFICEDAEDFDEWLRAERERFTLLATQLFNDLVIHHANQRNYLQAINYASRLLALDPLNEEMQRHLMTMLALSGQQNAALAQYRTCQQLLQSELGVEPDEETIELFERIQAGEFATQTGLTFTAPPPAAIPTNLPGELTEFINRTTEIDWLQQQLRSPTTRLVSLIGMGGIGKTRLATHVGRSFLDLKEGTPPPFAHGVYWVALAALEPSAQVAEQIAIAIAEAMKLPLSGSDAPFTQVANALANKSVLLLLDNFEQLASATVVIDRLLQQTQSLKVLVTSRTRLNLYGEQSLSLAGLSFPTLEAMACQPKASQTDGGEMLGRFAATRLFLQTARSVAPNFQLDRATQLAVVRTCHMMEGLPLGIELAASWTRILPCDEIVTEIQRDLDFLAPTQENAPAGQRSLRAVFNHSWRLLSTSEQQTLRRLAIFRGPFSREAANSVADGTLQQLASLVDKSLLRRVDRLDDENGENQAGGKTHVSYELQEMIRQFASEQLDNSGEQDGIAARHARYYRDMVIALHPALRGDQQYAALRQIAAAIENIRTAIQWFNRQLAAGLVTNSANAWQAFDTLFNYFDMRSWFQEGETLFRQTLAAVNLQLRVSKSDEWRIFAAQLQARLGWFCFHLARYKESEQLLNESLQGLRTLGAEEEMIFNLNYLGALLRHQGELDLATQYLNEALQLANEFDDRHSASIALNILGQVASLRNDYVAARKHCQKALEIKRSIGDRWGMTYSLTYLGRVAQAQRNHSEASSLFEESLEIYRQIGDRRGIAFANQNLGDISYRRGDYHRARQYYQESLQLYRDIGNRLESSLTLSRLCDVACAQQEFDVGEVGALEALRLAQEIDSVPAQLSALLSLASLYIADDRQEEAAPLLNVIHTHPLASQEQHERTAQLGSLAGQPSAQSLPNSTNGQTLGNVIAALI